MPHSTRLSTANPLWLLIMIVGLGVFPLDVILPSFPALSAELAVPLPDIALSISLFALCVAASQLLLGPLSDTWGRRRLLLGGLALSIIGAVGCALSSTYRVFMLFRLLQAVGCGCFVLAHALVQDLFTDGERARVRILLTTLGGVFIAVSPLLGSGLQRVFDWQGSFYVFSVLALVTFFQVIALLPPDTTSIRRISLCKAYAIVCTDRIFWANTLTAAIAFACHFSFIVVSPLLFMERLGLTDYQFSLALLVYGGAYIVGGFGAGWLQSRVSAEWQIQCGLGLIALSGVGLWAGVALFGLSVGTLLLPMLVCTAGTTIARPVAFNVAMARLPENAGAAAAVANTVLFATGAFISGLIALSGDQLIRNLACGFIVLSAFAYCPRLAGVR
jgi:DHA1 family 2-module integral membrane pump EmrD-like MFS transporter